MNAQLAVVPPDADVLLDELRKLHPRRACPRWAVLGPRYSGKSQFLRQFIDACRNDRDRRAPLPLYLDLKLIPLGIEERMYRSVFQQLNVACRHLPFEMSEDGPPDGTGRFDHFIRDLLQKANSRVALVVDHLDSVPQFFGRSLLRRFRLIVDQEGLYGEFKNLCLLLAGSTSLFDLRRFGDSTFLVSNLIFPRSSETVWQKHVGSNGRVPQTVQAKIRSETGGEAMFLDLLFDEIGPDLPLTTEQVDAAVERLLDAPERHDAFHQIVLEIASNRDLRRLARDITGARGQRIIRRDASPDIDRYCLSGVVVLHKEQSFACYRFRNGIVERFVKRLLDNGPAYARFPTIPLLTNVRMECSQSREVYAVMKELRSAWSACVFEIQEPTSAFLHVTYNNRAADLWIDTGRRQIRRSSETEGLPASAHDAVKAANESPSPHVAFGFDEHSFSFAIPFVRAEASLELVLVFPRDTALSLNENSLGHWLRLIDDCWPSLAAAALCELSVHFLRRLEGASSALVTTRATEAEARIHWLPPSWVILDKPGECVHYQIDRGGSLDETVTDMNQRCLRLMAPGRKNDFDPELRGVAGQLKTLLANIPDLSPQLQVADGNFVFLSDESGLKLPIELLPIRTSYLALESRISRRLRGAAVPVTRQPFAACMRELMEQNGTLKVLLAGADPRNSLSKLDAEMHDLKEQIERACNSIGLSHRVRLLDPIDGTLENLSAILQDKENGPYHLFHFCGHGELERDADESSVILVGKGGVDDPVPCERLRFLLHNHVLWMAYLSCCYGVAARGSTGIDQQYVGTAQAVLAAGIPNVVGFRWAVSDAGAYTLALAFYEHLLSTEHHFDPSKALFEARKRVAGEKDKRDAWASAMLISQCG